MASETSTYHPPPAKRPEVSRKHDEEDTCLDLSSLNIRPNSEAMEALHRLSKLPKIDIDLKTIPVRRVAAVLVLLHVNAQGGLSVTLTTRSSRLRSHPGGGRVEETDDSVVTTALRESSEEIGLPLDNMEQYGFLGILTPFVSRNLLIVYPIIYVLLRPAAEFLPRLVANEDEVANIFHWPLQDLIRLDSSKTGNLDLSNSAYTYRDVRWMNSKPYRWHSFSHDSMPSPITGLTADILITVATLAFNVKFEAMKAPGQEDWPILIKWALENKGGQDGDEHSLIRRATQPEP
ncbi:hypothetical protein CROQUDRAFT_102846 [Cronartium quercuum f. sp. fusiforme G11]|uniref:Nudix hydrolase domain-containing protein n=1 Tax=Cronartium quercuum f. sp. fusiforme G11 TaxID=708437 RepID=A0A9P6NU66_9BASI|nr:hypothetical protein CROQUDRAFT_102846 [Cronartium quercuum f. sp. fusiforme G11]